MNRKFRFLGLLALMLVPFAGAQIVTAQTDSEPVSTVLLGEIVPCAVDIRTDQGSLGQWQFESGAWFETTGGSTLSLIADVFNRPVEGCDIGITFDGLTGPGGAIDTSNFTAESADLGPVPPESWEIADVQNPFFSFLYTLETVPGELTAGVYSGSIVATVISAP